MQHDEQSRSAADARCSDVSIAPPQFLRRRNFAGLLAGALLPRVAHAADDAEAGAMFSRMGEKLAQMEEDDAEAGAAFSRLADALTKKEEEAAVVGEQFARLGMMLAEKAVGPEEA